VQRCCWVPQRPQGVGEYSHDQGDEGRRERGRCNNRHCLAATDQDGPKDGTTSDAINAAEPPTAIAIRVIVRVPKPWFGFVDSLVLPVPLLSGLARKLLTVVERADDGVIGFAEVPGVGMPRPAGPGGALVGAVTSWSAW